MASSAGILMYRQTGPGLEVLLVHPGGPFWRNKDEGAWSIPKGEMDEGEDPVAAARREFLEETGCALSGPLEPLGDIRQRGGKRVTAFAIESDLDVDAIRSNTFEIEWPPKGGKMQSFPEIDCQSAFKFDPVSASNFDPFERRVLAVALASSELAGVAETWRARAV
jgi:predicted NUDIX family NTP pyrophosphohydrolase